jgi:hypothetical protein
VGTSLFLQPEFRLAEVPQCRPGVRRPSRHLSPSEMCGGHTGVCCCPVKLGGRLVIEPRRGLVGLLGGPLV